MKKIILAAALGAGLATPAFAQDANTSTARDGFRIEAHIVIWQAEDVTRVPASALFREGGDWAVFVIADDSADPLEHIAFNANGHFAEKPADWGNPEQDLKSRQFFAILEACTDQLPAVQGRLFLMREWLEMSSEEICKELALTPTNLYVQLHRARLRLRECLDLNWFSQAPTR